MKYEKQHLTTHNKSQNTKQTKTKLARVQKTQMNQKNNQKITFLYKTTQTLNIFCTSLILLFALDLFSIFKKTITTRETAFPAKLQCDC